MVLVRKHSRFPIMNQGTCVTRPELIFIGVQGLWNMKPWEMIKGFIVLRGDSIGKYLRIIPSCKCIRQDESILLELSLAGSIQQILKHFHQSATFNANVRPIFFSYALPEFCDYKEFTTKTEIILHPMAFHRVKVRNHRPWPHVICSKISWSLGSF